MKGIMGSFEKVMMPLASKLGSNRYLNVIRDAFMLSFPLTIFGSMFVVLANLPFLDKFFSPEALNTFRAAITPAMEGTLLIATLFVVIGLGYHLSKSYGVDALFGAALALAAFLILTPFSITVDGGTIAGVIPLERLGAKGMFVGMFTGIFATEIYRRVIQKGWVIKMPEGVPPAVSKSFSALIPVFLTLTVFILMRIGFTMTPFGNIHDFIYTVVQKPLVALGSGLPTTLVAIFFIQTLWFFGLHGQIIVNSVLDPIWNTLSLENLEAFQKGVELPHIVTKQFIETFTVGIGGTGMTLGVVVCILMFAKSRQLKEVGKLSGPAGVFNVNEPMIFGLPIVMNPLILIPWIISPIVVVAFSYIVMRLGIVPPPTGVAVPWTVPIFFSGVLATNSVLGGVLQLVNLGIVSAIWFPFVKLLDKQYCLNESIVKDDFEMDLKAEFDSL
ncbi:MAG: PTS cellobiose transporter subunit IIC [Cetobacterium sp.]|uniref:PTS cellobiose transporter subunit IIC n=1 Tax=Cetobacterium sp. TaxID=2071632 RepID=UPI003EE7C808